VEDTDGSELEGNVEERLAVGRGDDVVIGGLEGNIARTEVVLISLEILLASGRA
jgi:hypothetical protein